MDQSNASSTETYQVHVDVGEMVASLMDGTEWKVSQGLLEPNFNRLC